MKVYLVIEDYRDCCESKFKVTPCASFEAAKKIYDPAVTADMKDWPDTIVTLSDCYYENFEEGNYDEEHSVIYIEEREVIE